MTRLRFLLVSFFGAVAACFGFDREGLARRWLAKNGFILREETVTLDDGATYYQWTISPPWGLSGTLTKRSRVRENAASSYLERLMNRDFEIVQAFYEPGPLTLMGIRDGVLTWNDVTTEPPRLTHTVTHRFPRPWWA